ncbi:MAG: peptide deformylase [Flavobacteriales bacterium]|nr:peptide deformylase [Flavobacteriales bacterium]
MGEVSQAVGRNVPLSDLLELMRAAQQQLRQPCVAAKHVGVNVRVIALDTRYDRNAIGAAQVALIIVNPEILTLTNPLVAGIESDPSIPDYQGSVERHSAVTVKFADEHFTEKEATFTDAAARWVLHAIELLDGRLFIDNLNEHRKRSIKGHLKRIASQAENGNSDLENGARTR